MSNSYNNNNNNNNNNNTNTNSDSESESELINSPTNDSLTVSGITNQIKSALYTSFENKVVRVVGEVSNFRPSRGNLFFTLKDDASSIAAVMWNYDEKKNEKKEEFGEIKDGTRIIISGKLTLFPKSGTYNIRVVNMEIVGEGKLYQNYMAIQKKYHKLGYFDSKNKKKLPDTINEIGVITSENGAALQDFLYTLRQNKFTGRVHIKSCIVQGTNCPTSVSNSIILLDKMNLDVIVVTRGGGSFEDLFGFSNPKVIEAIYKAKTPIVSAVGHEIDTMLSDLVADVRAPTPSLAGELLCANIFNPVVIDELISSLEQVLQHKLQINDNKLVSLNKIIRSPRDIIEGTIGDINRVEEMLINAINSKLCNLEGKLNNCTKIINSQDDTQSILSRGYSVLLTSKNSKISTTEELVKYLNKYKKLKILLQDGETVINASISV